MPLRRGNSPNKLKFAWLAVRTSSPRSPIRWLIQASNSACIVPFHHGDSPTAGGVAVLSTPASG